MATVSAFSCSMNLDFYHKPKYQSLYSIKSILKRVPKGLNTETSVKLKRIQVSAIKSPSKSDTKIENKDIRIEDTGHVFDKMRLRERDSCNSMIAACIQQCNPKQALKFLHRIQVVDMSEQCMQIHATILKTGEKIDVFTGSTLINLYAKSQVTEYARQVFDKMPKRNLVTWNAMISAYIKCECDEMALELFKEMQASNVEVDEFTVSSVLGACSSLAALNQGSQVHTHIVKAGFLENVYVCTGLIDMYAKCGHVEGFCEVFDEIKDRNLVMWTAMIAGYTQNGLPEKAIEVFNQILNLGIMPNMVMLERVLRASGGVEAIRYGWQVHGYVVKLGLFIDVNVGNALIDMYAKCGNIDSAYRVFIKMHRRDIVSWNSIIARFVQIGEGDRAVELFQGLKLQSLQPDQYTFSSFLQACAASGYPVLAMGIHGEIIKSGFQTNVFVANALVDMYCKCNMVQNGHQVFDKMAERNIASWASMISGYAQNAYGEEALKLACLMLEMGIILEGYILTGVLLACSALGAVEVCKMVHAHMIRKGFDSNLFVQNALMDAYSKCNSLVVALHVFNGTPARDVVSWNAIISGCVHNCNCEEALKLFYQMWVTGIEPDEFTFPSVIRACASLATMKQGKAIHSCIIKNGYESNIWVGTALIDMYMKCRSIGYAQMVFKRMLECNMISCTAMIEGYAQNGHGEDALKLFRQMLNEGTKSDEFTLTSVLNACASLTALESGKQVHSFIIQKGLEFDLCVGNAIIDMYAKCGSLVDAQKEFERKFTRDVVSWNAMIGGYSQQGNGMKALQLFEQMQQEGIKPNHITFVCILSACSNAGLLHEGHRIFDSISRVHGLELTMEHYACMVDLLGRAGQLKEAEDFINKMPFEPSDLVWRTLLAACRIHGNIDLGKHSAEQVVKLEPQDSAAYVLLSNIYAAAGRWDCLADVRKQMEDRGVKKEAGVSWIEVKGKTYAFTVMDRSHPQTVEIYKKLDALMKSIKEAGYVPSTNCVLHDVKEEQKEQLLSFHSEKLAIAFGLIGIPQEMPVRIIKSLRICVDCHNAAKLISKIEKRELFLRDCNRYHHFKDGVCSCGDYW